MRYAWVRDEYLQRHRRERAASVGGCWPGSGGGTRPPAAAPSLAPSRASPRGSAAYGREARVIYPPVVPTSSGRPGARPAFLVSALTPYKRLDVAVDAFTRLGWPLELIGVGSEEAPPAAGRADRALLGWQDDAALRAALARCRACLPAEEEFGIAPLGRGGRRPSSRTGGAR
jgi:glycosyltransferase involved in cell wall biosynthesis